jgi:hypothetical protein
MKFLLPSVAGRPHPRPWLAAMAAGRIRGLGAQGAPHLSHLEIMP